METQRLFSPQMEAAVGAYTFRRGVTVEVHSARDAHCDWAKVRFTGEFQPKLSITRKEPASIRVGYDGSLEEIFADYVARPYNGGSNADEIVLRDPMLLLEETAVNATLLDTTPQEALTYVLSQAGISRMKLSQAGYRTRRQLPIRKQTARQAVQTIHAAWGLQVPYFFSGGVFYWDEKPKQEKVYVFQYGVNILSLDRRGGLWVMETVPAPFIRHSHTVRVEHPRVSGDVEVVRTVTASNDDGFLRTRVYF